MLSRLLLLRLPLVYAALATSPIIQCPAAVPATLPVPPALQDYLVGAPVVIRTLHYSQAQVRIPAYALLGTFQIQLPAIARFVVLPA